MTRPTQATIPYRGRFAPSPTGPLHFGSLVAALGSYLDARRHGGQWLVRMEDVDPPREMAGAADDILRTLDAFGLQWDGGVLYQRHRSRIYENALEQLRRAGLLYPCTCSRTEIAAALDALGRTGVLAYPGTCRQRPSGSRPDQALRVLTADAGVIGFTDTLQGPQQQDLEREVGDFVLKRADGLYAYQLAVVIDDADQNITHVVRGSDLLDSTPRQIHLQHLLSLPTPAYAHLPIATNATGDKLSKQTGAPPVDRRRPGDVVWRALAFLGQRPPTELRHAPPPELLEWAVDAWELQRVPAVRAIVIGDNV